MGLHRRETLGAQAFRSLWISASFLVYFVFSHFKAELYWKPLPFTAKESFFFHITLQEKKDGARAAPTTTSTDRCLTEESRNSGLQSSRPLTKLIKNWWDALALIPSSPLTGRHQGASPNPWACQKSDYPRNKTGMLSCINLDWEEHRSGYQHQGLEVTCTWTEVPGCQISWVLFVTG